jgi:hypothetical protein
MVSQSVSQSVLMSSPFWPDVCYCLTITVVFVVRPLWREVGSVFIIQLKLKLNLRPTVSRPVRLGIGPPFGTLDQILLIVQYIYIVKYTPGAATIWPAVARQSLQQLSFQQWKNRETVFLVWSERRNNGEQCFLFSPCREVLPMETAHKNDWN